MSGSQSRRGCNAANRAGTPLGPIGCRTGALPPEPGHEGVQHRPQRVQRPLGKLGQQRRQELRGASLAERELE